MPFTSDLNTEYTSHNLCPLFQYSLFELSMCVLCRNQNITNNNENIKENWNLSAYFRLEMAEFNFSYSIFLYFFEILNIGQRMWIRSLHFHNFFLSASLFFSPCTDGTGICKYFPPLWPIHNKIYIYLCFYFRLFFPSFNTLCGLIFIHLNTHCKFIIALIHTMELVVLQKLCIARNVCVYIVYSNALNIGIYIFECRENGLTHLNFCSFSFSLISHVPFIEILQFRSVHIFGLNFSF